MSESADRRDLFRYLTADLAEEYLAIVDEFAGTLLAELSPAEVAASLAMDVESVEVRCSHLVRWGNLVTSVRDARVATVADYLKSRSRYQISSLGGRVHRNAHEVLWAVDGAREVARELLGQIADHLDRLLAELVDRRPGHVLDAEQLAGEVTSLFAAHRLFNDSVADFYAYLATVLSRYDLVGEEYAQFKTVLLDYVELITADVNRHTPAVAGKLAILFPLIDPLLDALRGLKGLTLPDGTPAERAPGRQRDEWEELAGWYSGGVSRSGPEQLRSAANQALGQLLSNAKRQLAESGTGVSRRADLLILAQWSASSDDETCHRLFDAAFGLYGARHLALGPDELDPRVGPTTSWWLFEPVDVPVSLRERGDRAARGRTARVPDVSKERAYLIRLAEQEGRARRAARTELVAAGQLHNARISPAARDLLLHLLATVFAQVQDAGQVVDLEDSDLAVRLHVEPGESTVVHSHDGTLTIDGMHVTVQAIDEITSAVG